MKSSLMRKYFTLFVAALIIASIVICMILIQHSIQELSRAQEEAIRQCVELAADACQREMEVLRGIALDIRVNHSYSPRYLFQSAYREVEMLREFSKIALRTNGLDKYFIVYKNRPDWAFTSLNNAATLNVYLQGLGRDDIDSFARRMFEPEQFFIFEPKSDSGKLFICFPLRFINEAGAEPQAALTFIVERSYFANIYKSYMSRFNTEFRIEYRGTAISKQELLGKRLMEVYSKDESVLILVQYDQDMTNNLTSYFTNINMVYPLLILLIIFITGIALSYASIRPLRRLVSRFSGAAEQGESKNELIRLERILEREVTRNDFSRYQLKQRLLSMLLEGKDADTHDQLFAYLHISLNRPCLCLFIIEAQELPADNRDFVEMVEELSDESISLYCVWKSGRYIAIAAMDDRSHAVEAEELLESLVDARGADIISGDTLSGLDKLPGGYLALCDKRAAVGVSREASVNSRLMENSFHVDALIDAVQQKDADKARELLRSHIRRLHDKGAASYLLERYFTYELLARLIALSNEMNVAVDESSTYAALSAPDLEGYRENVEWIIAAICGASAANPPQRRSALSESVIRLVNERCSDPDLSLDMIGRSLGISADYAGIIVKEQTGVPYKTYLTNLRIDMAKRLLVEKRLSVAETAESVGYRRSSNFIKKFKEVAGCTPLKYRDG